MEKTKRRGRAYGEAHHFAKYTNEDYRNVLRLHAQGYTYAQISAIMEMPRSTVYAYIKGTRRGVIP